MPRMKNVTCPVPVPLHVIPQRTYLRNPLFTWGDVLFGAAAGPPSVNFCHTALGAGAFVPVLFTSAKLPAVIHC